MQDIFIDDTGTGTPLVLIHGFLGSSEMWKPQINHFNKHYRVLAPAIPGFGRSSKIKSCKTIQCMAEVILEALQIKNINRFNLLGHSMGGMISQEIAKLAGDKIQRLILYGTGPIGNIPGRFETIEDSRKKLKDTGLEITANRIAKSWFIEGDKAKYFYLCLKAYKETSIETTDNALIAMKNWNGLENLKKIKNQTLIIWGDQDQAYNYNQIKTLKENIPNNDLKIFKDCSHNVHLEVENEFNKCLENFLKKISIG